MKEDGVAPETKRSVGRRSFFRTSAVGAAAVAATAVGISTIGGGGVASAALPLPVLPGLPGLPALPGVPNLPIGGQSSPGADTLVDAGAGMHAEMGTMQMFSAATIAPNLVTCMVGQMGMNSDMVAALAPVLSSVFGPGFSGPFAMAMFSENMASYQIDRNAKTIMAKGTMRSITKVAGMSIDDAMTPFLAVATDNSAKGTPDTFFLSYKTPFWNPASNPLATPSQFVNGYSQFGGELIMGLVRVAS
jgi:hypothetical protein